VSEEARVLAKKAIHFPYDFDQWYPRLKDFSFHSKIIHISPLIAEAMVHFYQQKFLNKSTLTSSDIENLKQLEKKIQDYISNKKSKDGIFVRMSNRSPKDGIPLLGNGETMLSQYQFLLKNSADKSLNEKMIDISDMQMKWLRCTTAQQVMNLLLTSERIFTDLNLALDCLQTSKKDNWSTSIILRDWQPELRQDLEFRVFVFNNKVTAISQYNHYCKFPSLTEKNPPLDDIYTLLTKFANSIHPLVKEDKYILDLAIIHNKVFIVELNPFDKTTGPGLFSWVNDNDLLSGKEDLPVCFRVREEPLDNLDAIIDSIVGEQESASEMDQEPYFNLYAKSCTHANRQ